MEPRPGPGGVFPSAANSPYQDGNRPGRRLGIASFGCALGALATLPLLLLAVSLTPAGLVVTNSQGQVISQPGLASRIGDTVAVVLVGAGLILPVLAVVLGLVAHQRFRRPGRSRNDRDFGTIGLAIGLVELVFIGGYVGLAYLLARAFGS